MKFYFKKDNINALSIEWLDKKGKKQIFHIAIPPTKYGIDLIDFDNKLKPGIYNYKFNGVTIVTTPIGRSVYYKGTLKAFKEFKK